MPKYSYLKSEGKVVSFVAITDGGHKEQLEYVCLEGESPEEMMSRVAHHLNDTFFEPVLNDEKEIMEVVKIKLEETEALPKESLRMVSEEGILFKS